MKIKSTRYIFQKNLTLKLNLLIINNTRRQITPCIHKRFQSFNVLKNRRST